MSMPRTAGLLLAGALVAGCAGHPHVQVTAGSQAPLAAPVSRTASPAAGPALASLAPPTPDSDEGRAAEAGNVVRAMLELVSLPAGSVQVSTPPAPELSPPLQTDIPQRIAAAARYFTVPGDIDAVLRFAQAHPPAGFSPGGAGQDNGPGSYSAYVVFSGTPTLAFGSPQLMVSAAKAGELIGVRVDAEVTWRPTPRG